MYFNVAGEKTKDGCRIKSGMTFLICHPWQPTCSTCIKGSPRLKRPMFSARVSWRRRTVPAVQPDMCGVITTLSSAAKSNFDGAHSLCVGVGYWYQVSITAPPI